MESFTSKITVSNPVEGWDINKGDKITLIEPVDNSNVYKNDYYLVGFNVINETTKEKFYLDEVTVLELKGEITYPWD